MSSTHFPAADTQQLQRRKLRFESVDEALAEAERLAAAEREGRLGRAGNWGLGRALGHLATWANFAFDGYPAAVVPPLPVRLVVRLLRRRILTGNMMAGVKIRGVPGGTLGLDDVPTDVGLRRFQAAMERLARAAPSIPNPMLGNLTHEEWQQLNLRHAELHLGFLVPREG